MRIWSVHPRFLDRQGLVACWRETLLAQAVLAGATRGYTHHPQLIRFRETEDPLRHVGAYLTGIAAEATARGYRFDRGKIVHRCDAEPLLVVAAGQLECEWMHLGAKLERRSPHDAARWRDAEPEPHPLFAVAPGPVAAWERAPCP